MLLVAGPRHRLISAESEVRDRLVRPKNSAWLMPVIQAAVVASRSKDPTGCWGPTFLSKLDMDAPVVGFTVLDII
jgi:hypothetical protein